MNEPPTDYAISIASPVSQCKHCRFREYCYERIRAIESVACEPGNEHYDQVHIPRNPYAVWPWDEYLEKLERIGWK